MRLSIVIPTCDRFDLLENCLKHVLRSIEASSLEDFEVIVTDDGPLGKLADKVCESYEGVTHVKGPRRGRGANRNNGVKESTGNWILFCDDDCEPEANWVTEYIGFIGLKDRGAIAQGRTIAERPRMSLDEDSPINEGLPMLWSCNFLIERAFFETLGGFDEGFERYGFEDVDLGLRVEKFGQKIEYIPSSVCVHPWRKRHSLIREMRDLASLEVFLLKNSDQIENWKWNDRIKIGISKTLGNIKLLKQIGFGGWWRVFDHIVLAIGEIVAVTRAKRGLAKKRQLNCA